MAGERHDFKVQIAHTESVWHWQYLLNWLRLTPDHHKEVCKFLGLSQRFGHWKGSIDFSTIHKGRTATQVVFMRMRNVDFLDLVIGCKLLEFLD